MQPMNFVKTNFKIYLTEKLGEMRSYRIPLDHTLPSNEANYESKTFAA